MANRYPPTPSFGGAFTSLPYSSLPPQQNGHNLFAGRPPVTSPMGALQSAGNAQSMNASHFASNAQIPSPGLAMPPVPPQPFPQEFFKQLANSSLPPPPPPSFPPVPIPNLGFPPYQPPPNLPNNFTPPQNHNPGNFMGSTSNLLQNQKESQPSFEKPSEPVGGSREEGELSDGELEEDSAADNSQTASQDEAFKMQMSLEQAYPNPETPGPSGPLVRSPPLLTSSSVVEKTTKASQSLDHSSRNHSHAKANMGNVLQSQRKNTQEMSPPSREDSGSSYDPPSVTTPDFTLDPSDARDEATPQVYGKSPSQMRELAKGALLSLAPHGIRYPDLVREGVDPDLLQQLYEEIGIKDIRPDLPAGNGAHQTTHPPERTAIPAVSEAYTNARPTMATDRPDSGSPSLPVALESKDAAPMQNGAPKSKSTDSPLQQTEQASRFPPGSPLATVAQNVAMERKDRIAQLLAAKTGRPAPVRTISDAGPVPVSLNMPPTTVAEGITLASTQKAPTPNIPNQPTTKSLKQKAQTELVRQKLESLKKEKEAKARAQNQWQAPLPRKPELFAGDASITAQTPLLEQLLSTNLYQHNTIHSDRPSSQTRSASFDNPSLVEPPSQSNYVYRIPGLFMTSDEAANVEEHLSTTAGSRADKSAHVPLDLEQDLEQASMASSTSVANAIQGSLTESNLAYLGNEGSTSRLPQKRPLASDSFDEPAPPTKRQFGRKDSVEKAEIHVDDGESDDGSDGIGMDIDEDSQASGLLINSSTPGKEASEQSTQTSPPVAKPPEPRPIQVPTANSSVGMSTPTKEKDKEDLWRAKNLEIEAMRKRIAEMEQRRKAKQSQSQAQSPQASLPATPASPKFHSPSQSQTSANSGSALPAVVSHPISPQGNVNAVIQKPISADDHSSKITPLSRLATESPSQTEDLRKKMARRKELQDGLPNLDAEVRATQLKLAQTKARLAAIKREAEKREAEIREARQREAEIAAEALKLEEQLNVGLNGRSRFSKELQSLGADLEAIPEDQNIYDDSLEPDFTDLGPEYVPPPTALSSVSGTHQIPGGEPVATSGLVVNVESSSAIVNQVTHKINDGTEEDNEAVAPQPPTAEAAQNARTSAPAAASQLNCQSYEELGNESGSQCQTPTDPDSSQASIVPRRLDETAVDASYTLTESSADLKGVVEGPEIDNDGSVSMSDSGSEDYEPAEIPDVTQVSDLESDGYDPDDVLITENIDQGEVSDLDDDYEPAEEVEPMDVNLPNIHLTSTNNYHPSEVREPDAVDQRPSNPASPNQIDKPSTNDIENGLELPETNTLTKTQDFQPQADGGKEVNDASFTASPVLREDPSPPTHFTPYESPLLFWKNFRFDPNFSARVAGGYNSLTYSNKIDPNRPVCPTEAEGGTCKDPKCEEQHFQQMVLPDDKILVEMSSARDFKQGDQRDRFVIGLKQVIAELRSKGVKEFPTVAGALAAHRRAFVESIDPNRSIPL